MNAAAAVFDVAGALIAIFGATLVALAALGLARTTDAMKATHALQLALGPGAGLTLLGFAVASARWDLMIKLALVWLALALAGPLIASALATAAHEDSARLSGGKPAPGATEGS